MRKHEETDGEDQREELRSEQRRNIELGRMRQQDTDEPKHHGGQGDIGSGAGQRCYLIGSRGRPKGTAGRGERGALPSLCSFEYGYSHRDLFTKRSSCPFPERLVALPIGR